MVDMEGRRAVIIGGGDVALRKIRDLINAGAVCRIITPDVNSELEVLITAHQLELRRRTYETGDIDGAEYVYVATDNMDLNRAIAEEAREKGIPANVVSAPELSDFFVPSFIRRGDFILALSTSGSSPAYAARLRRELEALIPEDIEDLLEALRESRAILQETPGYDSRDRGVLLRKIIRSDQMLAELVESHRRGELSSFLLKAFSEQ